MTAYYNEFDPKTAAWLRELIKERLIANGEVDERSILDVSASDLRGYSQHHFFAGIGGWSCALRLAGWPDDVGVWTASLPCQPFSAAGKGLGKSDERHFLPHFLELVRQCKPTTLFGEQVPGAIKHGWLDDIYAEMEAFDYAVGSIILGAHSIGAPHIRQRLYWVADNISNRPQGRIPWRQDQEWEAVGGQIRCGGTISRLGDPESYDKRRLRESGAIDGREESLGGSGVSRRIQWIGCRDGKQRPIEPGIQPLVDVVPKGMVRGSDTSAQINANATAEARAMRLKGYGNAIVPQLAAQFIGAYMAIMGDR